MSAVGAGLVDPSQSAPADHPLSLPRTQPAIAVRLRALTGSLVVAPPSETCSVQCPVPVPLLVTPGRVEANLAGVTGGGGSALGAGGGGGDGAAPVGTGVGDAAGGSWPWLPNTLISRFDPWLRNCRIWSWAPIPRTKISGIVTMRSQSTTW